MTVHTHTRADSREAMCMLLYKNVYKENSTKWVLLGEQSQC